MSDTPSPRYFERQPGERDKTYQKFCAYRDMGPQRTLARVAERFGVSKVGVEKLSRDYDWVARAQAYDDHLEMTRQSAIEEYEREKARDIVERRAAIQEEVVGIQEMAIGKLRQMLSEQIFFEREVVEEYDDGRPKTIINRYPAKWSYNTIIKAIEVLDDTPDKLALTDPSGEHEWGKTREEIERDFEALLNNRFDEED